MIHLMLENLPSLLVSMTAVKQKGKTREEFACPHDDFKPSLLKTLNLEGMFSLANFSLENCKLHMPSAHILLTHILKFSQNC